ncbi:HET-domain-containing protein [Hypoxylon trugodes]|uniref:HET-domain-containing protein n=1 Tax=Hypoxylon trugodes TaxID=326681 RepID=UPI0021959F7A|nr:HET-domain-containing protein [Hypoxylon trugodes]KAI1386383.1 HET-domain-containing protein [Hypoxylon trugodes]
MLIKSLNRHLKSGYEKFTFWSKRRGSEEDTEESEDDDAEDSEDGEDEEESESEDDETDSFVSVEEPYRAPAYPYRELEGDEIRLLRIVPGTGAVECLLHQIPLAEVKFFYALSYVWGDATEKRTIFLEGQPFEVTRNLFEALHQFRQQPGAPKRERLDIGYPNDYFWADAICINQADLDERARQVPRMIEIYHAGHVVIWLGHVRKRRPPESRLKRLIRRAPRTEWSQSDLLLDNGIKTLFKKTNSMWEDWEPIDEDDNVVLEAEFGDDYNGIITAIANVLRRPWFERVWTLQESCLDTYPIIYIGRYTVHLEKLIKMWKLLLAEHNNLITHPGSFRLTSLEQIDRLYRSALFDWDGNPKKMSTAALLATLIRITGRKGSSEPRDQLYGLLGLVKYLGDQELPEELTPDYRLPYESVYWNYAAFIFETAGDLKLLDCARNELQDVPSWVPDFRYFTVSLDVGHQVSARVSLDKKILHLQGSVLGTFRNFINGKNLASRLPTGKKIPVELSRRLREFDERILEPSAAARGITIEEAFNSMMEDATRIAPERNGKSADSFYQVYCCLRDSRWARRPRGARKRRTSTFRQREQVIASRLHPPCLLLTDGTILTMVREDAQVRTSDLLCIFKGAVKMSLLRPSGDDYMFIGQCRVQDGPMKQQGFDDDFWAGRELQDFNLI